MLGSLIFSGSCFNTCIPNRFFLKVMIVLRCFNLHLRRSWHAICLPLGLLLNHIPPFYTRGCIVDRLLFSQSPWRREFFPFGYLCFIHFKCRLLYSKPYISSISLTFYLVSVCWIKIFEFFFNVHIVFVGQKFSKEEKLDNFKSAVKS